MPQASTRIKVFNYKQSDYLTWLKNLSDVLGCPMTGNMLTIPEPIGKGYAKSFLLEDGFSACVSDYTFSQDYIYNRSAADEFGVIIYLYHFDTTESIKYKIEGESLAMEDGSHYSLRITNSQTNHQLEFNNTTNVKGISFYLEKDWLDKNISHRLKDVFNYLKETNYFKQFINAKQKRLMSEVVNIAGSAEHSYSDLFVKSRLYRLVDKLFENLELRDISESPESMSEDDFRLLQNIENILVESYDQAFPGIEKLSRLSLMSESKLKKLFKQSFGMGLYEYFQKNRMHRAKEQILSGKFSISEVGSKLGYQNLSNFSSAFKKEFQCLPSELTVLH